MNYKDKQKKSTVVVILIVLVILLIAVIFTFFYIRDNNKNNIVQLKPVTFSVSSEDSTYHKIKAQFSLSGNTKAIKKIGEENINKTIVDKLSSIKYEKLSGDKGTEYIKEEVMNTLKEKYKNSGIEKVYISDFSSDFEIGKDTKGGGSENGQSARDIIEGGMFKN